MTTTNGLLGAVKWYSGKKVGSKFSSPRKIHYPPSDPEGGYMDVAGGRKNGIVKNK